MELISPFRPTARSSNHFRLFAQADRLNRVQSGQGEPDADVVSLVDHPPADDPPDPPAIGGSSDLPLSL